MTARARGARERRNREKRREATNRQVLAAAQRTMMTTRATLEPYQYHDGQLIHVVMKDKRNFNVNAFGKNDWVERVVWATMCDRVIAVGHPNFLASKRAPTCVSCASDVVRWRLVDEPGRYDHMSVTTTTREILKLFSDDPL